MPSTYQFSNATKTIVENQLQLFSSITSYFIDAVEKIIDLNLAASKASVEDTNETTKQLFSVKDQSALFCFLSEQSKLLSEKIHFYNQQVSQISSQAKTKIDKVIQDVVIDTKDNIIDFASELNQHVPVGSDQINQIIAMWKGAFDQASAGYDRANQAVSLAAKQAAEMVGTAVAKATEQFSQQGVVKAAKGVKK
jgi:phasin family protein